MASRPILRRFFSTREPLFSFLFQALTFQEQGRPQLFPFVRFVEHDGWVDHLVCELVQRAVNRNARRNPVALLDNLLALVRERPTDDEAIQKQVIWAGATHPESVIYLRVLQEDGQVLVETPGMGEILPSSVFSKTQTDRGEEFYGHNHRSANGRWFRVVAVRASIDRAGASSLVVQVAMDRSHEEELLEDYRRNLWIVLGVALIVCLLGGYFLIRKAVRPVQKIAATGRQYVRSEYTWAKHAEKLTAVYREVHELIRDEVALALKRQQ